MSSYPFSESFRDQLARTLVAVNTAARIEPLTFVQQNIFIRYPSHLGFFLKDAPRSHYTFYRELVQYCEMAAWAEDPALIIELLRSLVLLNAAYEQKIEALINEGPFQCHPPNQPPYVCRVAFELPLFGRILLRDTVEGFYKSHKVDGVEGKRVLLTNGPPKSGKTYTYQFFRYLSAIQPLRVGVLYFDFEAEEILTQSANSNIPVELLLVQKLEKQARERRSELKSPEPTAGIAAFLPAAPSPVEMPFNFQPFANEQQRPRWTKVLVSDLVTKVLFRLNKIPEQWVLIFDNCEKAPKEIEQFMQSLVEITAGTDAESAARADSGIVRLVLLGDSKNLLPANYYENHLIIEELTAFNVGRTEIMIYFALLASSRQVNMKESEIEALADSCLEATRIEMETKGLPPEDGIKTLKSIIFEKTKQIERAAKEKRGGEDV